jgi:hypothetical protein
VTDELQEEQPQAEEAIDAGMEDTAEEPSTEAGPAAEGDLEQSEESDQGEDSADEAETSE